MDTVLITGATSGIGKATARAFAEKANYRLILCGRRNERLIDLKNELEGKVPVHILCFDIREREAVFTAIKSLPENFSSIDILVNNAGNAHGFDPVDKGNPDDWDTMLDINVKGLLYITRALTPGMIERGKGHIINIGSIAGKEVYTNGNVYCASKHAVDALSKGMLLDLNPYGIKVTEINPGLVETEFSLVRFKGDNQRAEKVYKGYQPLTPENVAEVILFTATLPSHVNISDLTILPTAQASATLVNRKI